MSYLRFRTHPLSPLGRPDRSQSRRLACKLTLRQCCCPERGCAQLPAACDRCSMSRRGSCDRSSGRRRLRATAEPAARASKPVESVSSLCQEIHFGNVRARQNGQQDWTGLGESFQKRFLPSPNSKGRPNASGRTGPTSEGAAIQISVDGKGLREMMSYKSWLPCRTPRAGTVGSDSPQNLKLFFSTPRTATGVTRGAGGGRKESFRFCGESLPTVPARGVRHGNQLL